MLHLKSLYRALMACAPILLFSHQETIILRNSLEKKADVEWLIVGAGPAGIATIGVLHDLGVPYKKIAWVDPEFKVGRIGKYYQNVPANNPTGPLIDFINACQTFSECTSNSLTELRAQDPKQFPTLGIIVPALQDITDYLRTQIPNYQDKINKLNFNNSLWQAEIGTTILSARHVVLAIGSHPKELSYDNTTVIPLDHALDKVTLADHVKPEHTIGVFGGSHSGILVVKYLYELDVHKIINFYQSPIVYTIDMGTWTLNAYDGLKGSTAEWARTVLEGENPPNNIIRIKNSQEARELYLPECDKVIYSIGYERNNVPLENFDETYNEQNGVIAPRLFGIGIAFPEYYCDPAGNEDHRVGLTSFMNYAQRIIPQWLAGIGDEEMHKTLLCHKNKKMLEQFENLFIINLL